MMKKNLVSIVVPCYNVEKYVVKCIESLINQTYSDIEIIAVNDGSTDSTIDILTSIAKTDERIKVYNKKNGGLSDARNYGLSKSNGNYICFADSDDYVDEKYIEKMYTNMEESKADIVACDFWYVDEYGKKWSSSKNKSNKIFNNIEAIKDIFTLTQSLEVMTWNKLYRKELFTKNNIEFPFGKLHEDNFTTYKLFYYSKNISLINDKLYYYLQRGNSIMGCTFNSRRFDKIEAVKEAGIFLNRQNISLNEEFNCYEFVTYFDIYNNMLKSNYNDEGKQKEIRNKLIEIRQKVNKNKYVSKGAKIGLNILCVSKKLYKLLYITKIKCRGGNK